MNEIEKAIEGLKMDNALLAGTGSEEVIKRNNLAIQALEEKAERDNPRRISESKED